MPSADTYLNLDRPDTWPASLTAFLISRYDLFHDWEQRSPQCCSPMEYDSAIGDLGAALKPFRLRGWHCTRLTDDEISSIMASGLKLPDARMLNCRINTVEKAGMIEPEIAQMLKENHQADDSNRAGMLWFCFYRPRVAGEDCIERFFRHWGGEALYNSHEDNSATSPSLCSIGTSCLIEADIPVSSLAVPSDLAMEVARIYLANRSLDANELMKYEDKITLALPPEYVRRVIRFPDPDFFALTGCETWRAPITQ